MAEDKQESHLPPSGDELKTIPPPRCLEPSKRTWPELVGMTSDEAERRIKMEQPRTKIYVVPQDSFITCDYRTDRVRLFVDPSGKVVRPPSVG